ncbi:TPA: glycerophosphodiester phosphodiesterase [Listeria monocytogenes]|nr:glycerophosphodiester phosphodiesterase [Listeria monocytogenes]
MTEIFAHRGSSGTHPENTIPAMKAAILSGADGIELDIHVLKSGELIVVPTLEEIFKLVSGSDIILNIELKTDVFEYDGIEQKVLKLAEKFPQVKRMYSSFNPDTLVRLRELDPTAKLALITHENLEEVLPLHEKIQLEAVHPPVKAMKNPVLKQIAARYWTVNKEEAIARFLDANAKGMMTDFPERAVALRNNR